MADSVSVHSVQPFDPGQRARFAFVLFAMAMIVLSLPSGSIAALCPPGKPIDYATPLRRLPRIRQIPATGRLPFGPRKIRVIPPNELLTGGGRSTFYIESQDLSSTLHLHWSMRLVVKRINYRGKVVATLGEQRAELRAGAIGSETAISLKVALPRRPSFYRSDLAIYRQGHLATTFSQYTRVLPVRRHFALRLDRYSFLPGETVAARLENHGTVAMTYEPGTYLEMWNGAEWEPIEEEGRAFPPVAISVGPGVPSDCQRVPLPTDLVAGHYRLEKMVNNRRWVRAYFEVR